MKTSILALATLFSCSIAFAKQPEPVTPVQPAPSTSSWELSAGVLWQEMNMQWDTRSLPSIGAQAFDRKESESVVAPSVVLSKRIAQLQQTQLLLSLGWSRAEANWSSGEFEAGEGPDELYTSDISFFDVTMNRFALTLDARFDLGGGFSAGVMAGPTVTFVSGDFRGTQETFEETPDPSFGTFRFGNGVSSSGTEAAFGVMGGAFLRYDFGSSGIFIQATGGYNWSDEVRFGSSQIGAKFDGSTWMAGLSVGFKF